MADKFIEQDFDSDVVVVEVAGPPGPQGPPGPPGQGISPADLDKLVNERVNKIFAANAHRFGAPHVVAPPAPVTQQDESFGFFLNG